MLKRITSAGMLILVMGSIILLNIKFSIMVDVFVALVCIASVFEFCKAIKTLKLFQLSIPCMLFAAVYPFMVSFGFTQLTFYGFTTVMLCMLIFFHEKISFNNFAYTYSMTLLITISLSALIRMKFIDSEHMPMYFVLAIAIPWLADVGAYFTGFFIGKHKLCPKISPKKTIEGAVGGVLFCIFSCVVMLFIFQKLFYGDNINMNYFSIILIGFGGSLLSIIGDLSFSVIKRSYSVKDYGDLIPGHGGILDRFDSVVTFVPYMYLVMMYIPIVCK